jgi:Aldehyde dehydrogenase family
VAYQLSHLGANMRARPLSAPLQLRVYGRWEVVKEPFGVVLIIAPWNFPLALLLNPLVSAVYGCNMFITYTTCIYMHHPYKMITLEFNVLPYKPTIAPWNIPLALLLNPLVSLVYWYNMVTLYSIDDIAIQTARWKSTDLRSACVLIRTEVFVLIIAPWNFPLALLLNPLASAVYGCNMLITYTTCTYICTIRIRRLGWSLMYSWYIRSPPVLCSSSPPGTSHWRGFCTVLQYALLNIICRFALVTCH